MRHAHLRRYLWKCATDSIPADLSLMDLPYTGMHAAKIGSPGVDRRVLCGGAASCRKEEGMHSALVPLPGSDDHCQRI